MVVIIYTMGRKENPRGSNPWASTGRDETTNYQEEKKQCVQCSVACANQSGKKTGKRTTS